MVITTQRWAEFNGQELKNKREAKGFDQKGLARLLLARNVRDVVYYDDGGHIHFKQFNQRTISYIEKVKQGRMEIKIYSALSELLR